MKLGDIGHFQSGGTPQKDRAEFFSGNIPWVSTVALNGGRIGEKDANTFITEQAIQHSAAKIVPVNSLLVGTRVGIGKAAVNDVPMATSQDIVSITDIDLTHWDLQYLILFVCSQAEYLNQQARGATIKGIKADTLKALPVKEISLSAQKQIVDKLTWTKKLIDNRQHVLALLDELVKARFVEMFGDPILNPRKLEIKLLKDITTKIGSGATPTGGQQAYHDEGISLIRSMNVYDNAFVYKDLAHIDEEQAEALSNVVVQSEDVLLNITGASVARCAVVPADVIPARVNQHVAIVRCDTDKLNAIYLNQFLISQPIKQNLLRMAEAGGATRQALTRRQLENIQVVVPRFP